MSIPTLYLLKTNLLIFILPIAQQNFLFLDFNFKNLKNVEKKVSFAINLIFLLKSFDVLTEYFLIQFLFI